MNNLHSLSQLAQLAPYGLGPLVAGYGAVRGARSAYRAVYPTRKAKRSRVPRSLNIRGLHRFKRSVRFELKCKPAAGFSYDGTNYSTNMSMNFSLNAIGILVGAAGAGIAMPDTAELTDLFDQFRIDGVSIKFFYQHTEQLAGSLTNSMPVVLYLWDQADSTVETNAELIQHGDVKRHQLTRPLITRGKPLAIDALASSGITPLKYGTFLAKSNSTAQHNSFKMVWDPVGADGTAQSATLSVYVDLFVTCKDSV